MRENYILKTSKSFLKRVKQTKHYPKRFQLNDKKNTFLQNKNFRVSKKDICVSIWNSFKKTKPNKVKIHPSKMNTFVTFWHSVWSNTSKKWRFRGPAKTSDLVKTHCKLLAIELLSDARLSCCTHVLYTTWNFLFGEYCQVDAILRLLSPELRRSWSKTAVFQFWRKVDFWQNWCVNIALFGRFAFRYHHFKNMGHEAN